MSKSACGQICLSGGGKFGWEVDLDCRQRVLTFVQLLEQGVQDRGVVRHAIGLQGPGEDVLRVQLLNQGANLLSRACK